MDSVSNTLVTSQTQIDTLTANGGIADQAKAVASQSGDTGVPPATANQTEIVSNIASPQPSTGISSAESLRNAYLSSSSDATGFMLILLQMFQEIKNATRAQRNQDRNAQFNHALQQAQDSKEAATEEMLSGIVTSIGQIGGGVMQGYGGYKALKATGISGAQPSDNISADTVAKAAVDRWAALNVMTQGLASVSGDAVKVGAQDKRADASNQQALQGVSGDILSQDSSMMDSVAGIIQAALKMAGDINDQRNAAMSQIVRSV